jgi:hypothetical protein
MKYEYHKEFYFKLDYINVDKWRINGQHPMVHKENVNLSVSANVTIPPLHKQ